VIRSFGRTLVDSSFSWNGWWIFDRKGYRHHYAFSVAIVRAPDGLRALSLMVGPARLTVGRIRPPDAQDEDNDSPTNRAEA
jgi:hypothetical protein